MATTWFECQACGLLRTNVARIPDKCPTCMSSDLWSEPGDEHASDFLPAPAEESSFEDPTEDE